MRSGPGAIMNYAETVGSLRSPLRLVYFKSLVAVLPLIS